MLTGTRTRKAGQCRKYRNCTGEIIRRDSGPGHDGTVGSGGFRSRGCRGVRGTGPSSTASWAQQDRPGCVSASSSPVWKTRWQIVGRTTPGTPELCQARAMRGVLALSIRELAASGSVRDAAADPFWDSPSPGHSRPADRRSGASFPWATGDSCPQGSHI